jgi:hypothetical protein
MKRRITVFAVAVIAVLSMATPAQAAPNSTSFVAYLAGSNEVPHGDPNATGVARLSLKANRQLCWVVVTHNVDGKLSAAHLHAARAGTNGPVVVMLSAAPVGCTWVTRRLARSLSAHPRWYYVNVHSMPNYPDGALRGQLVKSRSSR